MTNEGNVDSASTSNVHMDGGKKNQKVKKHHKGNEKMLPELTPSETQTFHPPTIVDGSDKEIGEDALDVTAREEWVARVEMEWQAVEILGRRVNATDNKF